MSQSLGHRAIDDGNGKCLACGRETVDLGTGLQHRRGRREGWYEQQRRTAEELSEQVRSLASFDERLRRIERKLDELLARSAVRTVDHRRLADGGRRVKRQMREAA